MTSPPTRLGSYDIIREIARSNDIVYEAFDPGMNRRVALKEIMIPAGATSPQTADRLARFQREAQAVGMLNHPNIMTVYTTGVDQGRAFMAMEYLDGTSLRRELDAKGTIPLDRTIEIVLETLDGLAHAHSHGVIHRDIKPDNIQIISSGTVKITDFGIARLEFQPNLTIDGQVFGTPSYMSPEQVVGREIDARSDIFSVGVMLYEMLTGIKPFAGDSVVTITYNLVNVNPNPSPQIPHPVWSVITTALEKSPSGRYATASAMRDALKSAHAQSNAPPVVSAPWLVGNPTPPVAAPPVLGSPYGPPLTPYGTPDPYALPDPYGAGSPYAPGGRVGLPNPIYYPPPPRAPLLKPETSRALSQFFKILVGLTLFFAIAFYAFITVLQKATPGDVSRRAPKVEPTPQAAPSKPVDAATFPARSVEAPASEEAEATMFVLTTLCEAGDQKSCQRVMNEIRAGTDELTRQGRIIAWAHAKSGMGEKSEGVIVLLSAVQEGMKRGESSRDLRNYLYAAEAIARGNPDLEQRVQAFRNQANI